MVGKINIHNLSTLSLSTQSLGKNQPPPPRLLCPAMGASYSKLTPGHEEAAYQLRKKGKSGREIAEALLRGVPGEAPVQISLDRARKVGDRLMEERDELYTTKIQDKPAQEGLRLMVRRLMLVAERELDRIERASKKGKVDAVRIAKLASALSNLARLVERIDPEEPDPEGATKKGADPNAQAVPSAFEAHLLNGGQGDEPAPTIEHEVPGPIPNLSAA